MFFSYIYKERNVDVINSLVSVGAVTKQLPGTDGSTENAGNCIWNLNAFHSIMCFKSFLKLLSVFEGQKVCIFSPTSILPIILKY